MTHESTALGESPRTGCRAVAGKLFGTVFFFVFFAMGCLFVVFIGREVLLDLATYRWQQTPAVVIESQIVESGDDENPYRLGVSYRYHFDGVEYLGDRVARSGQGDNDYSKVQRDAMRYSEGAEIDCFVDPNRPEEAVLERQPPWFALMIFLPLIFVAIGAIGVYAIWSPDKPKAETVSISEKAKNGGRSLLPIILGAVFSIVGGALFVALGVIPAVRLMRASGWDEVPCRVVSSTVRSHSSDDGTTYSVDILYEYEITGATWRSNRYDFANFSSSGHKGKREIVDQYPAGTRTICYVNPADPVDAVLSRGFRLAYLIGLFPLIFLVVGIPVTLWGIRQRRSRIQEAAAHQTGDRHHVATGAGPSQLKPRQSRAGKVFGFLIFGLIWNGILSVFLFKVISEWQRGSPDWFLAVFLVPFVLVGLGSIVGVVYFILGAFNPIAILELAPSLVRLGESVRVDWSFKGRSGRIRHLRIVLEGREEATYRRGTDTRTDKEVFARFTVVDTDIDYEISRGGREIHIPEDTMHSFDGGNNKIVWYFKINGDVPKWPDVDEEHPVNILPSIPEAASS